MGSVVNNPGIDSENVSPEWVAASAPGFLRPESSSWSPGRSALQALLAFSSLHEQIRQRRAQQAGKVNAEDSALEQFALDEVLQLVAYRALAITEADGVAIALAENNGIVCRASAGFVSPDAGMRIDLNSGFSGACLSGGQIVRCDDSEIDSRVNAEACRKLGARSMVAVPLAARQNVIGLVEAFSSEVAGFTDSNVRSLNLLAELILSALKPEEEDRLAEISRRMVKHSGPLELGHVALPSADTNPLKSAEILPDVSSIHRTRGSEGKPTLASELPQVKVKTTAIEKPVHGSELASELAITEVNLPQSTVKSDGELASLNNLSPAAPAQRVTKAMPGLQLVLILVAVAATLGSVVWHLLPHETARKPNKANYQTQTPVAAVSPSALAPPAIASNSASNSSQQAADSSMAQEPAAPVTTAADKSDAQTRVTGIRHWSSTDSSTVVIDLQDQVQYEAHRLSGPERIYLDLRDTKLAHELDGKIIEVDDFLLLRVRAAQPSRGVTRVVLETKAQSTYSVSLEQSPFRLVIQINKAGAKETAPTELHGISDSNSAKPISEVRPAQSSIPTTSPARMAAVTPLSAGLKDFRPLPLSRSPLNTKITDPLDTKGPAIQAPKLRIVLDAGHGGWDLGTVGRKGLLEKDLVLDIVERLGTLVQKRLPAEVIYTRQDDSYIALEKRAEIANVSRADLFVSVHANYSDSASARGVETYYTNTYSSLRARTADAERPQIKLQNIDWTHVDIRAKVEHSHRFAASIQHSLFGALSSTNPDIRNRGVKEAAYVVLTGTSMPAVLAEVSFVSSPTDENNLQSSRYRQQIAEALYKGIARYSEASRHVQMASSSPKLAAR